MSSSSEFTCPHCNQNSFKTVGGRKRHQQKCPNNPNNTLNQEKPIMCVQCGYFFSTEKTILVHLKNFHNYSGNKKHLWNHMVLRDSSIFECVYCDYSTPYAEALSLHLQIRRAEKGTCPHPRYSEFFSDIKTEEKSDN